MVGGSLISVFMRSCNLGAVGSDFVSPGDENNCALRNAGIGLGAGGFVGMITSGTMLRVRKQKRLRALRATWR